MARRHSTPMELDPSAGTNRREILLGAGGLAAVAAVGSSVRDRQALPAVQIVGTIDDIGSFDVLALSWGVSTPVTIGSATGGAGAGKVHFSDLSFTKHTDASTPKLFLSAALGQHHTSATITFTGRRGHPTITYEMHEVFITSLSLGGSSADEHPTENVTLAFGRMQLTVEGATGGFDVVQNKKV